jgi:hypothetical protein
LTIKNVSGQIAWRMRREGNIPQDYWKKFLNNVSELVKFRRERYGYHLYQGGRLFSVGNPVEQNGYVEFAAGFRDSKPSFVDMLFEASTGDFETCHISFFLRDDVIDFESLKKNLRSRCSNLVEEVNGNFSVRMRSDRKLLRLSGYPRMNRITISGSFTRGELPSHFLEEFLEVSLDGN